VGIRRVSAPPYFLSAVVVKDVSELLLETNIIEPSNESLSSLLYEECRGDCTLTLFFTLIDFRWGERGRV
jgi:hypothetical protein